MKLRNILGASTLALGAMIGQASATAITTSEFTFANLDTTLFGVPMDFGTLTVGTDSNGFTTLTLSPTSGNTFFDTNALDLNLASNIDVTSAVVGTGSAGAITVTNNTSQNNDGFGFFNTDIKIDDGTNSGISAGETLVVTLDTTQTDITQIFAANARGFDASGHVFNPTLGASCTIKVGEAFPGATTNQGPSDVDQSQCGSTTTVPEPASIVAFGTALATLGLLGVRRRRKDV